MSRSVERGGREKKRERRRSRGVGRMGPSGGGEEGGSHAPEASLH